MRFASIGSGSAGNGTLVQTEEVCVLIDLGFTIKETERRLRTLSLVPADITAILVTHEHTDHIQGVPSFARKHKIPVYMTPGTYNETRIGLMPELHLINCHRPFKIASMTICAVPVPHDAREPCQYVVSDGAASVGVLTDLGHITPHVIEQYAACDALLLEFNHDVQMLAQGPYPYTLKMRVGGELGHLNNEQAAYLITRINLKRLRYLVVAHISEKNNVPSLATEAVMTALDGWPGELKIANQSQGLGWIEL